MSLRTKVCFVVLGSFITFILDINESVSKLHASFYGTCLKFPCFYFMNNLNRYVKSWALSFYSTLVTTCIAFRYCDTIRDIMSCHHINYTKQVCAFCIHNYFIGSYHFMQIWIIKQYLLEPSVSISHFKHLHEAFLGNLWPFFHKHSILLLHSFRFFLK